MMMVKPQILLRMRIKVPVLEFCKPVTSTWTVQRADLLNIECVLHSQCYWRWRRDAARLSFPRNITCATFAVELLFVKTKRVENHREVSVSVWQLLRSRVSCNVTRATSWTPLLDSYRGCAPSCLDNHSLNWSQACSVTTVSGDLVVVHSVGTP